MHLAPLIRDLAVITIVAGLVAVVFRKIRQPLVLGYIVAGMIVGPHTPPFPLVSDIPNIRTLADLGVIFLMFHLGLEFSFRKLLRVAPAAGLPAVLGVSSMLGLGFAAARLSGWSKFDSVFLGAIVSISSTTIIVKALDELGLRSRRFAEQILGMLLVEDLIAVLILAALAAFAATGTFTPLGVLEVGAKLVLVVGGWFLAGYFLLPRFIRYVGRFGSEEMLTLLSVGLCLALVTIASLLGYSAALGAFIMGSILAESTESRLIEELILPLRDLFSAIFFVSVGMLIDPHAIGSHLGSILLISALVIVGKTTAVTLGNLLSGQRLQTSILVGSGMGQIGEFSFLIASLGVGLGVISDFLYPVAVAVSLLTTLSTPYLLKVSYPFSKMLERKLPVPATVTLEKYALWRERQGLKSEWGPDLKAGLWRWGIGALVIVILHVLAASYLEPFLAARLGREDLAFATAWLLAILLSAPFLWAMFTAFQAPVREELGIAAVLAQLSTLLWLGFLSLAFFPFRFVSLVTILLAAMLFARLYDRLAASYDWFERHFLDTMRTGEKSRKPLHVYRKLAPWGGHLVRIKVHADSAFSGQTLRSLELRKRHGVNVVAVRRGSRAMVAPSPDLQIFPKDELLVLGTDEQVDRVRPLLENAPPDSPEYPSLDDYELRPLPIAPGSAFEDRTIRESRLRDDHSVLVVGVERGSERIINPDTDLRIRAGDRLLIVGEARALSRLC